MNDIVSRIYELIAKSGIGKKELAERIGVSRNTVQNWKKLNSMPSLVVIEKICNVFNITVEQFFSGMGEKDSGSEREFIDAWRMLTKEQCAAVEYVMDVFEDLREV